MQGEHSTFDDSGAFFLLLLRYVLGLMSCDATYVKGHAGTAFSPSFLPLSCGQACLELEEGCSTAFSQKAA